MSTPEFIKRAAIVVALVFVPLAVWYLRDFVLIFVGALLVAILLDMVGQPFIRWCRLPRSVALLLSGFVILMVIGGSAYLFGTQIGSELQDVLSRADSATKIIGDALHQSQLGRLALSHINSGDFSLTSLVSSVVTVSARLLEGIIFTVAAGAYFAAQPQFYRKGANQLLPRSARATADDTLEAIGRALRLWLLGQAIQMFLVGVLSTLAVWLIGLPSPLALGVIAGVAEFVPYLGPIIASIPAILVAMTSGLYPVLWTIIAFILIHQIEGNLIVPLIQRRMIFVPPAVLLLSIVAISLIFGAIAIIFAAPITVIVFIAVEKLYLHKEPDCVREADRK